MPPPAEPVDPWRGVLIPLAATPVVGAAGGALWAWWADPAAYTVARRSAFIGEQQQGRYFDVEVRYAVIGLAAGFLVALALGGWLRRAGWPLIIGVVLGGAAAAALSYVVGVAIGPPDADRAALGAAAPGDLVPVPLTVETPSLFLSWAVGGLAGLVVVVSVTDRDRMVDRGLQTHLPDLPRG